MIAEDYCSYEVAKLLKEKGFDEPCIRHWDCDDLSLYGANDIPISNSELRNNEYDGFSAPTHQMAMAWLREVHKLNIGIVRGPNGYHITIETIPLGVVKYITREITGTTYVDSYENAVESALKFILENLI